MTDQLSINHLRNKKQIQITDQPLPVVLPKSFRNTNQVSGLLHPISQNTRKYSYQFKKYQNPITQQNHSLQVPKVSNQDNFSIGKSNKISNQHQNWLSVHKKFSKPYSQCTKYIDNLSQHKALIRRGPFNIPVDKQSLLSKQATYDIKKSRNETQNSARQYSLQNDLSRLKSVSYSINQSSNCEYKSVFRTKKQMIFHSLNNIKNTQKNLQNLSQKNKPYSSRSINMFDRSLNNQQKNYRNLMSKQRLLKQDNIALRNSVNKLVAMDMIKHKLSDNSHYTKNNLKKIQQKFKKKNQIIVMSLN